VDCTIDATPAQKRFVGRRDNGVDALRGDVAKDYFDRCHVLIVAVASGNVAPGSLGAQRGGALVAQQHDPVAELPHFRPLKL
jgi:hypothetical protein